MSDANISDRTVEALPDRVLTPVSLRALSTRSDKQGAQRLAIHLAALLVTGTIVAFAQGIWIWPAMLALGLVQVALFAPAHECMHRTAFASDRANMIVGWLAAAPSLLNLDFYRAYHLAHHRHTQSLDNDPELDAIAPDTMHGYLIRVFGLSFWSLRLRVIRDAWLDDFSEYPFIADEAAGRIVNSVRAMSLTLIAAAALSVYYFGWSTPFLYWIIPQLIAQPFLRAYLLAEHTGCSNDRNGLTNTRTTLTNPLVRLLMWNMPYHAEHHLYPSIPFHQLPEAHTQIATKLSTIQNGYTRWNLSLVHRLAREN